MRIEGEAARVLDLEAGPGGYFARIVERVPPGTRYRLAVDDGPWRPDPASRRQPEGVHGPSEVVADAHRWADAGWRGVALRDLVIYELEVGAFTAEGTFDAAAGRLDALRDLGVTAVELMPLAEVPGRLEARDWGYDGVGLFAVREAFGGAAGLHRFVDACHARGLAVIIDVVYNHLGPEGNYLHGFGPYFTDRYVTPWGEAPNLDGPGSDEVRRYFIEHALEQLERHHADGLRLDAVTSLFDRSATPFLEELSEATDALAERLGRPLHLIAETDDNDPRWVRPRAEGGLGLHAMWADDLHHALHATLTGERAGYYQDFGGVDAVARAFCRGSALEGQHAEYRGRRWGRPLVEVPPERLVVYAQNHDQIGNRADGARLSALLDPPADRAALALGLLSPHLPLLFMGQEVGSRRPFFFYTSFSDARLAAAVLSGRRAEQRAFGWRARCPDPQAVATFEASRPFEGPAPEAAARYRALHRDALALRPALYPGGRPTLVEVSERPRAFVARGPAGHVLVAMLDADGGALDLPERGGVLFDSEGGAPGLESAPPIAFDGPRVVVYGPPGPGREEHRS